MSPAVAGLALWVAAADADGYRGLVASGIARGREGDLIAADRAFTAAIAMDPARPEAWTERGGLCFLEGRYPDAIRDLQRALALLEAEGGAPKEGSAALGSWRYTRDLLGSALQLAGRGDEALEAWNPLGRPQVAEIRFAGLERTLDHVVRREIALSPGDVLTLDRVRETRRRLALIGSLATVGVRPVPRPDLEGSQADLLVAVGERHGLIESPLQAGLGHGIDLLRERVRPRYWNLGGRGIDVAAQYRWEPNRPDLSLGIDWPRPAGIPLVLQVSGFRGRQVYDRGTPLVLRAHGVALGVRRVVGSRGVAHLAVEARHRSLRVPGPDAPRRDVGLDAAEGDVVGIGGGLTWALVDGPRQRLEGALAGFSARKEMGSEVPFSRLLLSARGSLLLAPPEGTLLERSVLAVRLHGGWGGDGMPIDEMFAPGGSPDMELPLRAHPQARDGALGRTPLGRSLVLVNVEWRRRLGGGSLAQVGGVVFYDGARIARTGVPGPAGVFHDVGLGLRVAVGGQTVLRVDYGRGLTDGSHAVFVGLGQTF